MWESGRHCEVEREKPKLGEKEEELEEEGVFEEELKEEDGFEEEPKEEDVFEEEQNIIDDTISNFETIFTQAEKESFQRKRKKRNTIEMFDDMFDALNITVVEEVSDHVEETDRDNSINHLECVNTDVSAADITLTEASKETLGAEVSSSEIGAIAERLFSCNQCEKTFATETSLKKHIGKDHKIKSSERFACPECDWTGANKGVVKTHIKKKHR